MATKESNDSPLAKVYELLSNPVDFPKFMNRVDSVERINSQTFEYIPKLVTKNLFGQQT